VRPGRRPLRVDVIASRSAQPGLMCGFHRAYPEIGLDVGMLFEIGTAVTALRSGAIDASFRAVAAPGEGLKQRRTFSGFLCRDFAIGISNEAPCSPRWVRAEWRYSCRSRAAQGRVFVGQRARPPVRQTDRVRVRAHVARADDLAEPAPRRIWRGWVGLRGSGESVVAHLIEDTGDHERVLTAGEHAQVVEPPDAGEPAA
jgi:hypothetical protein